MNREENEKERDDHSDRYMDEVVHLSDAEMIDYVCGFSSPIEVEKVRQHIQSCDACRECVEWMKQHTRPVSDEETDEFIRSLAKLRQDLALSETLQLEVSRVDQEEKELDLLKLSARSTQIERDTDEFQKPLKDSGITDDVVTGLSRMPVAVKSTWHGMKLNFMSDRKDSVYILFEWPITGRRIPCVLRAGDIAYSLEPVGPKPEATALFVAEDLDPGRLCENMDSLELEIGVLREKE